MTPESKVRLLIAAGWHLTHSWRIVRPEGWTRLHLLDRGPLNSVHILTREDPFK